MTEISPIPWRYEERCIRPMNDGRVVARLDWSTRDHIDDNNGAFIVKAVNMHQELVDAITACGTALSLIRFDADQNPQLAEAGRLVRAVLTKVA